MSYAVGSEKVWPTSLSKRRPPNPDPEDDDEVVTVIKTAA
jgi:hypothetical protein